MPKLNRLMFAVALLAIGASSAVAAPKKFAIDPNHTEVTFTVRHIFSNVTGSFKESRGTILFDEQNTANSSVVDSIATASIFTNNDRRDNHLRSDDFLNAEKFPYIVFKSTKVTPLGKDRKFQIYGDLTIRDVTKPVVLDAELLGVGPFGIGGKVMATKAGFVATTKINRQDYGVKWNKTLDAGGGMLSDDVVINLNVEADGEPPVAAAVK